MTKIIDTSCTLGVGDGSGNLYVHGDYESIKHLQGKILRMEKMYTRDEVEELIHNATLIDNDKFYFDKWIEENLKKI